jgi:2-phospho-L-lactate/phosphoenolpyruvate guanylyltransferase
MSLRIIIPVKPYGEAKQRLAPALSDEERAELARRMFQHVFATALRVVDPANVIVVTRARNVIDFAAAHGATGLAETGSPGLNAALTQASEFARDASRLLILASDLPFLSERDLAALTAENCAIAPDRHGRGTNALTWPAQRSPAFHFGDNSFERHRAAAISAGLVPRIVTRPGLAHDIDVPADLVALDAKN